MGAPPRELLRRDGGKIVLLVMDGLGGLPDPQHGKTEMEAASLPHLDALAARSSTGRAQILDPYLTPGSGPGHLSLFGYDPQRIDFGRGLLEALGSDYPLAAGEVAARGNFCTIDAAGLVQDRRAGRPPDAECKRLCEKLTQHVQLDDADFVLLPGKQHRFTLVVRGNGLGHHINDNDPQVEGKPPHPFAGRDAASEKTAALVTSFFEQARQCLRDEPQGSGVLLRGFSSMPDIESYDERYALRAAVIAIYPMYRGVARLVGMNVLDPGTSLPEQIAVAQREWDNYDFFFLHTKDPDTAGHSGDFAAKVSALEAIDQHIPQLEALLGTGDDNVLIITGDHSTPTIHREHSWHPVPLILQSQRCIPMPTPFHERGVMGGDLGTFSAQDLMGLALAHAGRLDKFGA
ncbi:MAG: 2,3-bisphosphoglycerate-independent phosphoglycerate mutase [Planctomycetota bacterium]